MAGKSAARGGYVALLRGINVGGKNKLPMKELAGMFAAAGCEEVRTYIQSGNVVFRAGEAVAGRVAERVASEIAGRYGYRVPVVLRTAAEMRRVVRVNPFVREGVDSARLHVIFLADRPAAARVRELDFQRSAPDRFEVHGSEIYLDCPNGMARTKLTNSYFDARLKTVSTARNWRTVMRLLAMVEGA